MIKHLLNKQQRDAGLSTMEDDHTVTLVDTTLFFTKDEIIARFNSSTVTIEEIQTSADEYLIDKHLKEFERSNTK